MAITFTADGKDYKLEATAATIRHMDKAGINFKEVFGRVTCFETLWKGLFIAHHNTVPDKKRMEIYNALSAVAEGNEPELDDDGEVVDELMNATYEEYVDALNKLRRAQGNVSWKRTT